MAFELYRPIKARCKNNKNCIRAFFTNSKIAPPTLQIHIGRDLCAKLDLHPRDVIELFVDSDNPRLFKIRKSQSGTGYHVTFTPHAFYFKVRWTKFVPTEKDLIKSIVCHQITDENEIIIHMDQKVI